MSGSSRLKKISVCCLSMKTNRLYLGTEGGNIYLLDINSFELQEYIIYQDVVMQRLVGYLWNCILLAFSCLWHLKKKFPSTLIFVFHLHVVFRQKTLKFHQTTFLFSIETLIALRTFQLKRLTQQNVFTDIVDKWRGWIKNVESEVKNLLKRKKGM